ncbi:cupin domain-containing protein [Actinomadura rudentiformis]|uniref:Cupin n=1 Tax=Actinomadura rudentiformis TaxID=359158 RepID=A0A6H9Y6S1_9ACTN|nr:cupin [Actinomadura rudentiformis]KAB2339353.1 cupin [Actinomadura rudentiformis]
MTLILAKDRRRTETPNGVMTTLASPTQGGAGTVMWRVDMLPGREGSLHAFDAGQVWTFVEGGATVQLGDEKLTVAAGDSLVMHADVTRQVFTDQGFAAVVVAPAGGQVYNPDGKGPGEACDLAPRGDERVAPPWVR